MWKRTLVLMWVAVDVMDELALSVTDAAGGPICYDCNSHGYIRYYQMELDLDRAQQAERVMREKHYRFITVRDVVVARKRNQGIYESEVPMVPRYPEFEGV